MKFWSRLGKGLLALLFLSDTNKNERSMSLSALPLSLSLFVASGDCFPLY